MGSAVTREQGEPPGWILCCEFRYQHMCFLCTTCIDSPVSQPSHRTPVVASDLSMAFATVKKRLVLVACLVISVVFYTHGPIGVLKVNLKVDSIRSSVSYMREPLHCNRSSTHTIIEGVVKSSFALHFFCGAKGKALKGVNEGGAKGSFPFRARAESHPRTGVIKQRCSRLHSKSYNGVSVVLILET